MQRLDDRACNFGNKGWWAFKRLTLKSPISIKLDNNIKVTLICEHKTVIKVSRIEEVIDRTRKQLCNQFASIKCKGAATVDLPSKIP